MKGQIGSLVLLAATIAGILTCVLLAAPFLAPLIWALVLAVMAAPLHARLEVKLKQPSLAAAASVLIVLLVVAVPAAFVVGRLLEEAISSVALVQAAVSSGALQRLLDAHPAIAPVGTWIEQWVDLSAVMTALTTWGSNFGASFAKGSVVQVLQIVLTFYLLFYCLRDRRAAGRLLRDWMPLTHAETRLIVGRVLDAVHAIIYGTVAVAAVQGALGGLMFWILGLPTPLLWGLVMGLLSIVPVLGSFIVWIPAAMFLALDGSWGKAAVLVVWGAVVVGGVDNILRPMFVGGRLRLHTVPAFISIVGGLILFGASGFILGPLTVTVTILLLEIWRARDETLRPEKGDDGSPKDRRETPLQPR